jgi:flagellar hook assembly protein FlgD
VSIQIESKTKDPLSHSTHNFTIYNVKGEAVQSLIPRNKDSKTLSAEWNGLNRQGNRCPAGIYFIKTSAAQSWIKKILLLN